MKERHSEAWSLNDLDKKRSDYWQLTGVKVGSVCLVISKLHQPHSLPLRECVNRWVPASRYNPDSAEGIIGNPSADFLMITMENW